MSGAEKSEEKVVETPVGALEGFRERKELVTTALRDVADVAGTLGAATLRERISRDLVVKLEEDRFHLVVVGEFNHGKTTFVNALLGANVLPVGVTPTTATIHHLRHGDEPKAKVSYMGGREEPIEFEKVRSFMVGGESARPSGAGGENVAEEVSHIEVSYPAPLLRERIVLVDTPGVNDLSHQRADITYGYIPKSDAVLFLLDAGQILKESERVFLQEKIIGQARDKIVFVITKWDILDEAEQKEALDYAKVQLAKFVKGEPMIYPVSAENALKGNAEASGMPELVDFLTRFLAEHRGRILLDNALGEGLAVARTLVKGVDAKRRALVMDEKELGRRISAIESDLAGQGTTIEQRRSRIREDVGAVRAWARRDLDRFVEDATRMITAQVDNAEPADLKSHFQSYLEHVVKQWAEAETKEIGSALEQIAERTIAIVREDATDTARRVGDQLGGAIPGLKVEVDSFAFDVGVMASLVFGLSSIFSGAFLVGGVLLVAAPLLGMLARDRINAEYKRTVRERTPIVLREIASKVGPKIDAMIDEFANKLDAWVVSASEDLHRELLEVLKSAKDARSGGLEKSASERAETEVAAAKLTGARAKLEELRAGLWGDAVRQDEKLVEATASIPSSVPSAAMGGNGDGGGAPPPVNAAGGAA